MLSTDYHQYLCEMSLLEADPFLQYVPSRIAAAAMALSRYTLGMPMWPAQLQQRIGYALEELTEICGHLAQLQQVAAAGQQQAIQDKYKTMK